MSASTKSSRSSSSREAGALGALDPVDRLPGLGGAGKKALAEHGIRTVADLVWTPPSGWDDLRAPLALAEAVERAGVPGGTARLTFAAVVESASMFPLRGRRGVRVVLRDAVDEKCKVHAFWFFWAKGILDLAKPGVRLLVLGRIAVDEGGGAKRKPPRLAHPDLIVDVPDARVVRPRYPKLGPSGAALRKAIGYAASAVAPDPVPPAIAARERFRPAGALLAEVHAAGRAAPPSAAALEGFVERLAWAEAFTRAWERLRVAERDAQTVAPTLAPIPLGPFTRALGFAFTGDQKRAWKEISADLATPRPMRRLLLGDVGTGKTALALAALAQCVASGKQGLLLAPTSVLAEQYRVAARPLVARGARVVFVAAGAPAAERRAAERALAAGDADVAIGTHALLGAGVVLPKLALVVVDEQQRLGVAQRLGLVQKGTRPHLLTLSATPIPRTLALVLRGELATSRLEERPGGRGPVRTEVVRRDRLGGVVADVEAALARGERVFWVVPRIALDEADDELTSAEERAKALALALPPRTVGVIHGRLGAAEKRDVMSDFRSGARGLLVGTTVVEVGVDVPEATLIVIENAERLGLAQLHQLRGRVGRGARPGRCLLLHPEHAPKPAVDRLEVFARTETGEAVARADLALRGGGDLWGTRQHGPEEELRWLEESADYPWLERIDADARALRSADPSLERPEHAVLGAIVARIERAIAVREEAG